MNGSVDKKPIQKYFLQFKRKQLLRDENQTGFAILKTLVTSPMLEKIAQTNNVKCINTPTGFKWMAKKLKKYEEKATYEIKQKEGLGLDYDNTDLFTRIEILSKYSTCVALAAEESYGYLPVDLVRDKDGNAAALAIAELFSFIKSYKTDHIVLKSMPSITVLIRLAWSSSRSTTLSCIVLVTVMVSCLHR